MRPSANRHPLAILRGIANLTQRKIAEIVDRSVSHVQKVELGSRELTMGEAEKIEEATGACRGWLMRGDPHAPPRATGGRKFTRETYEATRQRLRGSKDDWPKEIRDWHKAHNIPLPNRRFQHHCDALRFSHNAIHVAAIAAQSPHAGRLLRQLHRCVEALKRECNIKDDENPEPYVKWMFEEWNRSGGNNFVAAKDPHPIMKNGKPGMAYYANSTGMVVPNPPPGPGAGKPIRIPKAKRPAGSAKR